VSWYTDGGSMRGSGIYSKLVEYDEFTCEHDDCGAFNPGGTVSTDDWGNYGIDCSSCYHTHYEGNIDDKDEDY